MENQNIVEKKSLEKDSSEQTIMPTTGQNLSEALLKTETVIDKNGVEKIVDRTKIHDQQTALVEVLTNKNIVANPSDATPNASKEMLENRDRNSDIVANREIPTTENQTIL